MQFIPKGPDIPARLLQAHEEGRVVFFCGAGISYPAGLPTFPELVTRLYSALEPNPNPIQKAAIDSNQYDTAIGLLEGTQGIVGGHEKVRKELVNILKPDFTAKKALSTHQALLTLGRHRNGRLRLITTNFDRVFEEVILRESLDIERFQAPLLPVPKQKWDGLVYLHGLLSKSPTTNELYRLVLSSGDFGLAYLTERWASRFISELFRNYTICFVGYSINDPVMRYMMDALAADKQLGEATCEMFAFGSFTPSIESQVSNEWKAKNVTPILYAKTSTHSYLHKTLIEWAKTYNDGTSGKEQIVAKHATTPPTMSTVEDNYVGRVLWSISDSTGLPAKHFARLDPVPPIEWLEPLSHNYYEHQDLSRYGVPPKSTIDSKLFFSIVSRPCPYTHAQYMEIVDSGSKIYSWDFIMNAMAEWLLRHLNDPKLIFWISKRGGHLHDQFKWLILRKKDELNKLLADGNTRELERISIAAPNAIPDDIIWGVWRIVLSGRLKSYSFSGDIYGWFERLKNEGLSTSLRVELRDLLAPRLELSEPFRWHDAIYEIEKSTPKRISDIFRCEIVLSSNHPHSIFEDHQLLGYWQHVLPELILDFTIILRDIMELKAELGLAGVHSDSSYSAQPSVAHHSQNKKFHDWTIVVELVRDAWLATSRVDQNRAISIASEWFQTPFPIFKRLAFFAAAQDSVISTELVCKWISSENYWWLWSEEVRREMLRLLVAVATKLDPNELLVIEEAILLGPPRAMFGEEIEHKTFEKIKGYGIWIRLEKMREAGAELSPNANIILANFKLKNPNICLADDQSDEFPFWMGNDADALYSTKRQFQSTPKLRKDLVKYLKEYASSSDNDSDDWRIRCTKNFSTTACALYQLAEDGIWPIERWRDALQAWSEAKLVKISWRYMAPVIAKAPDALFVDCSRGLAWWLGTVANASIKRENILFALIERILNQNYDDTLDEVKDPISKAINHPIGIVVGAIFSWLKQKSIQDDEGLSEVIKPLLTYVSNTQIHKLVYGRVILASNAIYLFRVDPTWAQNHLLPLFDWSNSQSEALYAWKAFLWSPRLYWPLLQAIKVPYLQTVNHFERLGEHAVQYADLLTYSALESNSSIAIKDLTTAIRGLPKDGLNHSASTLSRAMEGAGDQREAYWLNRVKPFIKTFWPKSPDLISSNISESFARLIIATGNEFPQAFNELKNWLVPIFHPNYIIHLLEKSQNCSIFPEEGLDFLDKIIAHELDFVPKDLEPCLSSIVDKNPNLNTDMRYLRLIAFVKRNN